MSKKQGKIKKVKKAVKSAKAKPSPKKAKAVKAVKKIKTKPVKKAVKKIVKKKSSPKKIIKPLKKAPEKLIKKAVGKVSKSSKVSKPVKKIPVKKTIEEKQIKPVKSFKEAGKLEKQEKSLTLEKEKLPKKTELSGEVKKTPKRKKKKQKNDDDEPMIIEDILIEQLIQSTKRKSKQPKVPKILKTFVNPMASLTVATPIGGKKGVVVPKKEPKGKFELEYVVRTSPGILYELLTTPSGLSEWFADDVNIRDGIFTFFWDGSEQKARLLGFKEEQYIRMQWIDKPEGSYFEFRIQKDELTGDISLIIIDFADEASDMQTSKLLWDSQVNKLLNVLGSN